MRVEPGMQHDFANIGHGQVKPHIHFLNPTATSYVESRSTLVNYSISEIWIPAG